MEINEYCAKQEGPSSSTESNNNDIIFLVNLFGFTIHYFQKFWDLGCYWLCTCYYWTTIASYANLYNQAKKFITEWCIFAATKQSPVSWKCFCRYEFGTTNISQWIKKSQLFIGISYPLQFHESNIKDDQIESEFQEETIQHIVSVDIEASLQNVIADIN